MHFIDSWPLPLSEYFLFGSVIVVCVLSLLLCIWCERITHCSKENTSGTSSNICLHFSDLPLSTLGLSLLLYVSLPTLSLLQWFCVCLISYTFKSLSKIHFPSNSFLFSSQFNLQIMFLIDKTYGTSFIPSPMYEILREIGVHDCSFLWPYSLRSFSSLEWRGRCFDSFVCVHSKICIWCQVKNVVGVSLANSYICDLCTGYQNSAETWTLPSWMSRGAISVVCWWCCPSGSVRSPPALSSGVVSC